MTGAIPYSPKLMSMQMLLTRLTVSARQDPSSANVAVRAQELHAFCMKFEKLVGEDLVRVVSGAREGVKR